MGIGPHNVPIVTNKGSFLLDGHECIAGHQIVPRVTGHLDII